MSKITKILSIALDILKVQEEKTGEKIIDNDLDIDRINVLRSGGGCYLSYSK